MAQTRKITRDFDLGASKFARGLLGSLDRRLIDPAGTLVRFSGWVMMVFIAYITIFDTINENERRNTLIWLPVYAVYLIILEFIRKRWSESYDTAAFRYIRVAFNLVMVSSLVGLVPSERHLLIFAYIVPIFATVVYFAELRWIQFLVFFLVLVGMTISHPVFNSGTLLKLPEFLKSAVVLIVLSVAFEFFRSRVYLVPSSLTELARELNKTLDLQKLMADILDHSIEITQAQRGLIIVVNPRNKRYVGHSLCDFKLKEDRSIEDLAQKCFVLVHGQPFDSTDLTLAFKNNSIYHQFFETQPRSLLAEPLFNRAGEVIGVINVAHDEANGFEKISKNLLREFAYLISSSIENCFEHREVILSEAKSREAGKKFMLVDSEDDVIQILIEETRQQIQHSEKITLHKYLSGDMSLLPLHYITPETPSKFFNWSHQGFKGKKTDLRYGYGIAGHALELRDTILVSDTAHHPWFVRLDSDENIGSLLVAPLVDPEGKESYGTISLESKKTSAFSLEDESRLTYLSTQASRMISKMRDFQEWRKHGGALRQILEQIGAFDLDASETELCEEIAEAGGRLLGFKITRIRILTQEGDLKTVAMTGVSQKTKAKLIGTAFPYTEIKPFLCDSFRAESSYLIKADTSGWAEFVDKHFHKPSTQNKNLSGWGAYDALITPLMNSSGGVLGILTLDVPNTGEEPSKQILELIGVFANSASWVIELSRSHRRLIDQKLRAQSFIDTISHDLAKCRDIPAISEVVVQAGSKLLSAEGCSLYLIHGNTMELAHSNYLAEMGYITRRKPISDQPGAGLTAWVASTGKLLCLNNGTHKKHPSWAGEEEHLQYLPSKYCHSILIAPIKDKEEDVIGVLTLENKRSIIGLKDFDDDDETRLQSLANEFAKAIEVIGLYDDMREWERSGLADDIHDLINWYHSGVVLWLEALDVWFSLGDYEKTRELMPELLQHAHTTVNELKTLHTIFLNKSFEASNLREALEQVMTVWTTRSTPKYKDRMQIQLSCPDELAMPAKLRNTLIRIASLAFSNALQHSGVLDDPSICIQVMVGYEGEQIILSVIDNGNGMDTKNLRMGFGLDRMRQLNEKINYWKVAESELDIQSAIGQGTQIFLRLRPTPDKAII